VGRTAAKALSVLGWPASRARGRAVPDPSALRILAHVGGFLPRLRGGAEVSLARTLRELTARGHHVRVVVDDPEATTGVVEGLEVTAAPSRRDLRAAYRWADVAVTQLDARNRAVRYAAFARRPIVHFVHTSGSDLHTHSPPDLRVFAADWRAESGSSQPLSIVLHPLIDAARYRVTRGDAVTLVNLSREKGAELFYELAARLPEQRFLGVRGGWGPQIVPTELPPNVEIAETTPDMRVVYGETRVLVLPSAHELHPRVPLEAACSGIPTVATPLEGVREAMGSAALYADGADLDAWVAHLRRLADPEFFAVRSRVAQQRFAEYARATAGELDVLERHLVRLASAGEGCALGRE